MSLNTIKNNLAEDSLKNAEPSSLDGILDPIIAESFKDKIQSIKSLLGDKALGEIFSDLDKQSQFKKMQLLSDISKKVSGPNVFPLIKTALSSTDSVKVKETIRQTITDSVENTESEELGDNDTLRIADEITRNVLKKLVDKRFVNKDAYDEVEEKIAI